MTPEELNRRSAELMGLQEGETCWRDKAGPKFTKPRNGLTLPGDWNPCGNLEQAFAVQAAALDKNQVAFMFYLGQLRDASRVAWEVWLVSAPPRARVEASVKALEKGEGA